MRELGRNRRSTRRRSKRRSSGASKPRSTHEPRPTRSRVPTKQQAATPANQTAKSWSTYDHRPVAKPASRDVSFWRRLALSQPGRETIRWYAASSRAGALIAVVGLINAIAALNDIQAFAALATPATYGWLCLSLLCWGGLAFSNPKESQPEAAPWYFRSVLLVGLCTCLLTVSIPFRIFTKRSEDPPRVVAGQPLDARAQTLRDESFTGARLQHSRLAYATLIHVDLSNTNLQESDLRHATLQDVDLSGADLCGADLRGTDLRGARGLSTVRSWAYAFYDNDTQLPDKVIFPQLTGAIRDTGRGLLYMCEPNETKRVSS